MKKSVLYSLFCISVIFYAQVIGIQKDRYDIDDFNCLDYTIEFGKVMNLIGVEAHQVVGENEETGIWHSWVALNIFGVMVHIEPQNLFFMTSFYKYSHVSINENILT